jgi:protoheme IX farnesyltransferase
MYTPLKQVSPWCTFVGAFPGAMPPVLGWTAARGHLEWEALALFAILFFWQFPHFHAIAWMYRDDYARGGVRMLPVVEKDGRSTLRAILSYSLLLIPVSVVPTLLHMAGWIYAVEALLLSIGLLAFGLRLSSLRQSPETAQSRLRARHLLQASVLYLPVLLILLMLSATF